MKNTNQTEYVDLFQDPHNKDYKVMVDSTIAFDNAIKRGLKNPDDYMYMYTKKGRDYFKHILTRKYKSFPQYSLLEKIRQMIYK